MHRQCVYSPGSGQKCRFALRLTGYEDILLGLIIMSE